MHNVKVKTDKKYGYTIIEGIDKSILDLDKTFDCGQCFRWNKQGEIWIGIVGSKVYKLRQMELEGKQVIITDATIEDWDNILYNYFDLSTDYTNLIIPNDDKFAQESVKAGLGIRILRQDPWETLISFIISQRNNIPKIKNTINKFSSYYGRLIKQENGIRYYSFPSIEKVSTLREEDGDFDDLGLGYRVPYIMSAASAVKCGYIDLNKLASKDTSSIVAVETLQKLYGVGPKVANCVALFGLGKLDMFPIDVWIQRIIDKYYNGHIDSSKFGSLAGLMQQYMFYYMKYIGVS